MSGKLSRLKGPNDCCEVCGAPVTRQGPTFVCADWDRHNAVINGRPWPNQQQEQQSPDQAMQVSA